MARHWQNLVVVGAALDDHIDLQRRQPNCLRHFNALENIRDREINIVHPLENAVVQRVQTHSYPLQTCIFKRLRLARKQRAIGGQRDVQRLALRRLQPGKHLDQHFNIFAQQGLAARQADFLDAVGHKNARQTVYFFKTQQ